MYKDLDLRFAQDDKVFDRLMTDAEPLWRRMMELTVAFAAQAKRQQSNALSVLGSGSGPLELEMLRKWWYPLVI